MLCHDHADAVFEALRDHLDACAIPAVQADLYRQVLDRTTDAATHCEVFLPLDLPLAVAAALGLERSAALRATSIATLMWAGADLMDDAADGDLMFDEWAASPHQLALVYTNLLATLPHLVAGEHGTSRLHRRLAAALWQMSHGQFTDLGSRTLVHSRAECLEVVAGKTGAEAAFFASLPPLIAGLPEECCDAWSAFGSHVGGMLQLYSDLHAIFLDGSRNDLLHGKRTLPVVHTLESLSCTARDAFIADLEQLARGDQAALAAVTAQLHACGAVRHTLETIERLRYRAAAALPVPLAPLVPDHPLRRLLRSCDIFHAGPHSAAHERTPSTPPRPRGAAPPAPPPPPPTVPATGHAERVAAYYDEHTEPFYLARWDHDDIHFGFFDETATALGTALKAMTRAILAPALIKADDVVLDAGCGVGGAAVDIAREHGAQVLGLTISPRQIELAAARAGAAGLGHRVRFALADCSTRLPVEDASVDVVLNIEAACHFADKLRFLRECYRVLRPGGRLVGSDWMRTPEAHGREAQSALAAVESAWHLAGLLDADTWHAALAEVGFAAIEVEDFGARARPNAHILSRACLDLLLEAASADAPDPARDAWFSQCRSLADAWTAGWFTITRFSARKPDRTEPPAASDAPDVGRAEHPEPLPTTGRSGPESAISPAPGVAALEEAQEMHEGKLEAAADYVGEKTANADAARFRHGGYASALQGQGNMTALANRLRNDRGLLAALRAQGFEPLNQREAAWCAAWGICVAAELGDGEGADEALKARLMSRQPCGGEDAPGALGG